MVASRGFWVNWVRSFLNAFASRSMVSKLALPPRSSRLIVALPTPARAANSPWERAARFRKSAKDGTGTPLVLPPTLVCLLPYTLFFHDNTDFLGLFPRLHHLFPTECSPIHQFLTLFQRCQSR